MRHWIEKQQLRNISHGLSLLITPFQRRRFFTAALNNYFDIFCIPFMIIPWQLLYFKRYEHIETYILLPKSQQPNQIYSTKRKKKSDKVSTITDTKTHELFSRKQLIFRTIKSKQKIYKIRLKRSNMLNCVVIFAML